MDGIVDSLKQEYAAKGCGVVEVVFQKLLEEIRDGILLGSVASGSIPVTDSQMMRIQRLFGDIAVLAFDILDRKRISVHVSPNGRKLYGVEYKDHRIKILPPLVFCPCDRFLSGVLRESAHVPNGDPLPTCEHILAIRLSDALRATREIPVTDAVISDLILSAYH